MITLKTEAQDTAAQENKNLVPAGKFDRQQKNDC